MSDVGEIGSAIGTFPEIVAVLAIVTVAAWWLTRGDPGG